MKNVVSFTHAQVDFALILAQISMTKLTNEVVHHKVEIVKNVVSFAHVQVENVRILAYNQYDKIDK